jgi:hypothetical protein
MPTSPVVEFRNPTTPFAVITSLPLTGTGFSGAIPAGTTSNVLTVRIYNNFAAAGSVADALNCVLTSYDDVTHQSQGTIVPVTGQYLHVQVMDYNGVTTGADTSTFGIGGTVKHPVPTNSGTISGTGANYITVNVTAVVPANATQGAVSQGFWLEYSSTS